MNYLSKNLRYLATMCVAAVIGIAAVDVIGQTAKAEKADKSDFKMKSHGFCENNNWSNGDRVSASDLREMTVASTGTVNVDAGQNGGISVKGEDRGDVLVRACVQAWGTSEDAAKSAASSIRINTSGEIRAEGPSGDKNWSVSFEIRVPRSTNTSLKAHNGGISVSNVDGTAEFETTNGGVNVSNLAGSVKGRTANGGVNVTLAGTSWKGSGLDIQTTNGGVNLTMAENYQANIETGTVNGGFKSDIPSVNVTTENIIGDSRIRSRSSRVNLALNGGGAPIRVVTTNGGVKINTPD
ncbi:MAG: DUF4097 family beta strand repeat-containing protein [Pyrinomonadaceae bacterium]